MQTVPEVMSYGVGETEFVRRRGFSLGGWRGFQFEPVQRDDTISPG